jgi:small lipoprotein (TIGR04452 family)
MLKIVVCMLIFTFVSCSSSFSTTGIKGKDALKDIEEYRSTLFISSFPLLFSTSSSLSSSSSSTICNSEGITSVSPVGVTASSNFAVPSDVNTVIDLVAPGGVVYFRSAAFSPSVTYSLNMVSLKTATISTPGTCSYTASTSACGTSDLSALFYSSLGFGVISNSSCLAIKCSSPAVVRVRISQFSSSTSFSSPNELLASLLGSEIFKEITAIQDETYYTKESFDKCKEDLVVISGIQNVDISSTLSRYSNALACNLPTSGVTTSLSTTGYTLLQANACKLEPAGFLGL